MTTIPDEAELENFLGPVGVREYQAASEWERPVIKEWIVRLWGLPDEDVTAECASKILDSALVMSKGFKGNWEGTHVRATACFREAKRRHEAAGHDPSCSGDTLYSEGMNRARRSQGYAPDPVSPCTCGLT